jgi:predicted nuclease of predicted toxin-antitoxin system
MRLLLDENLPKRLKADFPLHEVFTVHDKGWNGVKNGELLKLMLADNFNALLTFDKNLQHQQNFSNYTITVFDLSAIINTYAELTNLSGKNK